MVKQQYKFNERKSYSQLHERSKSLYSQKLTQLHRANLTISQALRLTNRELHTSLGIKKRYKIDTMTAYKSVYKQIRGTKVRRENTVKRSTITYQKDGYVQAGLKKAKAELTKVAGNTFSAMSKRIEKHYNVSSTEADEKAKDLLKIPDELKDKLNDFDKDLLQEFSP